jgi:hypothetical protein
MSEERVPNGTFIREHDTKRIYKIVDAIETNNQFGYGVYLYRLEGTTHTGFGLYRKEFDIMQTKVVAGFPGVGKSFFFDRYLSSLDSDSSLFSWIEKGVRNPDFPNNYMDHIKYSMGRVDFIFVSTHEEVRRALEENDIEYTIVYPSNELKEEYLQRYRNRGSDEKFIQFIGNMWYGFIEDIEMETYPKHVKLKSGQYLKDVLEEL